MAPQNKFTLVEYLQVLDAELMAVHVDGRKEDGLHLVVAQFVRRQVRRDQHLEIKARNSSVNVWK